MTEEREMVRILMVEDNEKDARALHELLREPADLKFDVREVSSACAAESYLTIEQFDIVLLDLFLTDSSGIESFDRIREAAKGTPVIVLTGLESSILADRLRHVGAADYLLKGSVSGEALARSIRSTLRSRSMPEHQASDSGRIQARR